MSRPSSSDVSALILAGGKATRFGGIAKHEIVVEGETILARQTKVLAPRVAEVIVSSPRDLAGYRTVRDDAEGIGPLAGIAAGLAACRTQWLLVVAGDMPYITGKLVDQLIRNASESVDAVAIRLGGLPEPLCCLLHARALPTLRARIAAGDYKASRLLTDAGLRVCWIDDADPAAVRNLNSPEDLGG